MNKRLETYGGIEKNMLPYRDTKPGDIGFEPILTESESAVLPLDESPTLLNINNVN